MANGEARVLQFLAENAGVITRSEVLALGMKPATLARRVQTGHLVAVGKGLYVQPGVMAAERTTLLAATHALDAIASHQSAARLHELDGVGSSNITVTVPVRKCNRFGPVIVHQLTDLEEGDVTVIRGIPTTDPKRTIIDLAAVIGSTRLATILDEAHRRRLTSYEEVAVLLESLARRGKPGVTKLRSVLKPRLEGFVVSESALETRLHALISRAGLPPPTAQFRPPWLKSVNGRVDLAYVDERLIVEGDSRRWHGTPESFQADRHRDNLAQLAGWRILRFTWEDITRRPSYVVDSIRQALSVPASYQIRDAMH
jgi:predicted transcriptional regulator of viral defense system